MSGDNLTQKTQKKDPFTSLHKIKENLPHWVKLKFLRNGAYKKSLKYTNCSYCTVDVLLVVSSTNRRIKHIVKMAGFTEYQTILFEFNNTNTSSGKMKDWK